MKRQINQGFTLIEVMITLVIVAILSALATPSVKLFMENSQIKSESQRIANLIALARNQAVTDNQAISVTGTEAAGALNIDVFTDIDGDAFFDGAPEVYIERSLGQSNDLDYGNNAVIQNDGGVLFNANGRLDNSGVIVLTVCDSPNTIGRQIEVNLIGRVSVSTLDNPGADCQ